MGGIKVVNEMRVCYDCIVPKATTDMSRSRRGRAAARGEVPGLPRLGPRKRREETVE